MLWLPEYQGSVWVTYRPDFVPGLSLGVMQQIEIVERALNDSGAGRSKRARFFPVTGKSRDLMAGFGSKAPPFRSLRQT